MNDSPTFSPTNASNAASHEGRDSEIKRVLADSDKVLRETQTLLQSLSTLKSSIIDELEKAENDNDTSSSVSITSLEYILQNCETQHREFRKQLNRVEERIRQNMRRYKVLHGTSRRRNANERTEMDDRLEEQQSLMTSLTIVDDTLTMVSDTRTEMKEQGVFTSNINKGLAIFASKFPRAGELMSKIKKYRNRDSIILASVCGICMTLMFIYWLNK